MTYIQIDFQINNDNIAETGEILIALLGEFPFDSFEEHPQGLRGFMPEKDFDKEEIETYLTQLCATMDFDYQITNIEDQNWNKKWESNYPSVLIDNKCLIRAPFHPDDPSVDYQIVIEPKMSFGTAHHETTSMMISYLLQNQWHDLAVLDMGCGTGVLAILASMKGAKAVVAIDNDEWAYENTLENLERNNIANALTFQGGREAIPAQAFDSILANINRNILLDQIETYSKRLKAGGKLFMSGFYEGDVPVIVDEAAKYNLHFVDKKSINKWVAVKLLKKS
jgi:ribosomal protein L11 methyltransferase